MILKIIKLLNWDAKSFLYLPDAASVSLLNALITTQIIKNFHILLRFAFIFQNSVDSCWKTK